MTSKTTEQAAEERCFACDEYNCTDKRCQSYIAGYSIAESNITELQATLSEYKQKVEALEGENAELLSKLNDATFEIGTGVDIVEGLQAENERLKGLLGLNAC